MTNSERSPAFSRTSQFSSRTTRFPLSRRAFTLIELLVTIAIIAVLAAIVAPAVFRNVGDAKTSAGRSQIEILALALDAYRLDNDVYPSSEQGLAALRTLPTVGEIPRNWRGPYLRRTVPLDPWGRPELAVTGFLYMAEASTRAFTSREGEWDSTDHCTTLPAQISDLA